MFNQSVSSRCRKQHHTHIQVRLCPFVQLLSLILFIYLFALQCLQLSTQARF